MDRREGTIRTAFVLGAGLGLRLRPLTDDWPKPLLPVRGRPLMTYALDHLLGVGVRRFIVNTHHRPERYNQIFPDGRWRGVPLLFRHEPVLLNTGGGLKNIEDLLEDDESLWVYNGDILADLPLAPLRDGHGEGKQEVTLALRSRGPCRNVSVDGKGRICDFRFVLGAPAVEFFQFTGIYLVRRSFLGRLRAGGREDLISVLLDRIRTEPGSIGHVVIDEGGWEDVGTLDAYEKVNRG